MYREGERAFGGAFIVKSTCKRALMTVKYTIKLVKMRLIQPDHPQIQNLNLDSHF